MKMGIILNMMKIISVTTLQIIKVELFILKPEIQFSIPTELNENELILDKNILRSYLDNLDKPYHYSRTYDNAQIRKPNQYKILPFSAKKLSWKVIITEQTYIFYIIIVYEYDISNCRHCNYIMYYYIFLFV